MKKLKTTEFLTICTSLFLLVTGILLLLFLPSSLYGKTFDLFDKRNQVLVVLVFSCVLTVFLLINNPYLVLAVLILKALLLQFICKALGVQERAYEYLLLSLVIEASVFLPLPMNPVFILVVDIFCLVNLQPHSTDGVMLSGISLQNVLFILIVSIVLNVLASFLKKLHDDTFVLKAENVRLESAIRKITDTNLAYQNYTAFIQEKTVEQERQRISREIHDIIGYTMTNVLMLIQAALHSRDEDQMRILLEKAQSHLNTSVNEARLSLRRLRERDMFELNGPNVFLQLTRTFAEITGIHIDIDFANIPNKLDRSVEKVVYRFLQEGMTNSFRHGRASVIHISFWVETNRILVRLVDNGSGSDAPIIQEGLGIKGMRERIELLGGKLTAGAVSDGFAIMAEIPMGGDNE